MIWFFKQVNNQRIKKNLLIQKKSNLVPHFFSMLNKLKNRLSKQYNDIFSKKLLLAISGGIDSMVLIDLMKKLNLDMYVAHCNFALRGKESDLDEVFVVNYCKQHNIPVYSKHFDTEKYARTTQKSIQISARELRYKWFFELKEQQGFDYIVTAHHLDDSLETFLINLSRGTGIEGLVGIPENKGVIRPLLGFSRKEIEDYASKNQIQWREDASNQSDKYLRNNIRHHIVPLLKKINPEFLNSFSKTTKYLQEVQTFSDEASEKILSEIIIVVNHNQHLNIDRLLDYKNYKFILYKWLSKYGFTAWDDIYDLIETQTGKFIETNDFKLLKNRNELILFEKKQKYLEEEYLISEDKIEYPLTIHFYEVSEISDKNNPAVAYVDKNLLKFPLKLRKYKEGEYFYPFGMQVKKKKISKFFKDEKLSILQKENTWVLCSDNQVVWIVGQRLDERYKVTSNTTSILKIEYLK